MTFPPAGDFILSFFFSSWLVMEKGEAQKLMKIKSKILKNKWVQNPDRKELKDIPKCECAL